MHARRTTHFTLILAFCFTLISANELIGSPVEHPTTSRPSLRPTRTKRMYKMCPPKFHKIGNECYYISTYKANWLDAHFECKDRNSKLAEPLRLEDRRIRKYLLQYDRDHTDKWIGANYNWQKHKWQWGYTGRDLTYQAFSRMPAHARAQLKYHCAVLSADLRYRWSPRSCTTLQYFVCEHRMPVVSAKERQKIYQKWNETYPNELANEIEVIMTNQPSRNRYRGNPDNRDYNRIHPVLTTPKPRRLSDINPTNYGDTRPADRRSRQHSRNFHPVAPSTVSRPTRINTRIPTTSSQQNNNSPPANRIPPSSAFHVDLNPPKQFGQRIGSIQQRIPYDNPAQGTANSGQRKFDYNFVELPPSTTTTTTPAPRRQYEEATQRRRQHYPRPTEASTTTSTTTTTTTRRPTTTTTTTNTYRPPTTTESSTSHGQLSESERRKKQYRDNLRERLSKLSPEEQREFFERRKQKKLKEKVENNV